MIASMIRMPSGTQIVIDPVRSVESVCASVWYGAGSRDERPAERGAAHLLEHLVLRADESALRRSVADVGGGVSGLTTQEYTCFSFRVPATAWRRAFAALAAALRDPVRPSAFGAEQAVVRAEIRDRDADPRRRVHELGLADLLGTHPLARDPLGRPAEIDVLEPPTVERFRVRSHTGGACLVVVSGNAEPDQVREAVETHLAPTPGDRPPRTSPVPRAAATGCRTHPLAGGLAHLVVSFLAPGQHDPRRDALSILNYLLGGSTDSLVWRQIRDELGLAYNVYTYRSTFSDLGVLSAYASCHPADVHRLAEEIRTIMRRAHDLLDADLVAAAARALAGSLALGLEAPHMRANWLGRLTMATGAVPDFGETVARIASTTASQVRDLLAELLAPERSTVTILGTSP